MNLTLLTLGISISSTVLVLLGGSWLIWGEATFKHLFASLLFASPVFVVCFAFFYFLTDKYVYKYRDLLKVTIPFKHNTPLHEHALNIKNKILKREYYEKIQRNHLMCYSLYGAAIGAFIGILNLLLLLDVEKDPSGSVVYIFLFYFPSFIICLPWSLITIFTEGNMLNGTIMAIGAVLNGIIIGAAYGALKK
jgi:hypothetical protein